MAEKKETVTSLTRQLAKKEKEYEVLENRFHSFLESYVRMEKQQIESSKAKCLGECIAYHEHPIVITDVEIGHLDFCVLSQGRVYRLFYDNGKERKMLYFAPKAYFPADRLLECYFVIGTKGKAYEQQFIPECVHGLQYYNRFEGLFPDWAQSRDCMLPLDFYNMYINDVLCDFEFDNVKAMAKQVNPKYQLLKEIIPNMRGGFQVRLVFPDYKYLKKNHNNHTKHSF